MFNRVKTADQIVSGFMKITTELDKTAKHFSAKADEHAVEIARAEAARAEAVNESNKAARINRKLEAFFNE